MQNFYIVIRKPYKNAYHKNFPIPLDKVLCVSYYKSEEKGRKRETILEVLYSSTGLVFPVHDRPA